jgi:tetratricopeptide (TPR) repeat protein
MTAKSDGTGGGTALQLLESAQQIERAGKTSEAASAYIAAGNAFLHIEADATSARAAFCAAAAVEPDNLEADFHLARTDMIEGKLRAALARFVKVIRRSGQTHVAAIFEAGCIYQELGQHDQAMLAFRKVLDRDRTNVQAIVNVARRLQAMGMRPEALSHYTLAAETAFEATHYGTCRQLLNLILSIEPLNAKARTMLADLSSAQNGSSNGESHVEPLADFESITAPPDGRLPILAHPQDEDRTNAALKRERDRLETEVKALGSALAAQEIELAELTARRQAAAAVLTELYAKIESMKAVDAAPKQAVRAAPRTAAARTSKKTVGTTARAKPVPRRRGKT